MIHGEDIEEPNENEKKSKKCKILNFIPDFMKKFTKNKISKINQKEKKLKMNKK